MGRDPVLGPIEEWDQGGGQIIRGVRCTAPSKGSGMRCRHKAREGFSVCPNHGVGYRSREERGLAKQIRDTPERKAKLYVGRLTEDEVADAAVGFDPIEGARRAAVTTELLLRQLLEEVEKQDAVSRSDLAAMLQVADQLARASKTLAEVETKESFTWTDLVNLSKLVATLFIDLSRYVPEAGDLRNEYLQEAEQGVRRAFRAASGGGVQAAE